ncbi:MAG: substrate-binding domain-containing protein [Spirochaetales bacterium]|nr:substrate-binding domain-containing protein [Spirochaetales bacterium]MCF7937891.1 substrate-binding domain-containing protein [Spirochaetales bacterium]
MKRVLVIALLLCVVAAFAFAGGQQEKAEDEKIEIAGIIFQDDQFFKVVQKGMQKAADEYGVELLEGNSQNNQDKEIQLVQTYMARGVDAICISPLSATASVSTLKQADEKGINVVTYNSPLEADFPVSYINSSQTELGATTGKNAREYIQNELGGEAKVATLGFKALLPEISDARVNGFLDQIRDLPGVEIVAQQDAWLPEDAVQRAGDILTANPDLDIIYGANEGGTVGSVLAVKNAGKAGDVAVFGIDVSEQLADFLLADDNILQAVTGQQPMEIGYQSVEYAVKSLKGESVPETVIVPGLPLVRGEEKAINDFKDWLASITE